MFDDRTIERTGNCLTLVSRVVHIPFLMVVYILKGFLQKAGGLTSTSSCIFLFWYDGDKLS